MISSRIILCVGLLSTLVSSIPTQSHEDSGLLDPGMFDIQLAQWLDDTDPQSIKIEFGEGIPTLEEAGMVIEDLFDPDWRVAHGLHEPRRNFSARGFSTIDEEGYTLGLEKRVQTCNKGNPEASMLASYAIHDILHSYGTRMCEARGYLTNTIMMDYSLKEGGGTARSVLRGVSTDHVQPAYHLLHRSESVIYQKSGSNLFLCRCQPTL